MACLLSYTPLAELSDMLEIPDLLLLLGLLLLDKIGEADDSENEHSLLGLAELSLNEHSELPWLDMLDVLRLLSDTLLRDCVDGLLPDRVLHELDDDDNVDADEIELLDRATVLELD